MIQGIENICKLGLCFAFCGLDCWKVCRMDLLTYQPRERCCLLHCEQRNKSKSVIKSVNALESWDGEESEPQSDYEVWLFKKRSKGETDPESPSKYYLCFSGVFQSVVLLIHLPLLWTNWQQRVTWKKHTWKIYLWNSYINLLRRAESRPIVIKSIALYCKVILFCSSAKRKYLLQLIGGHWFCGVTNSSGLLKTRTWSHISSICINTELFQTTYKKVPWMGPFSYIHLYLFNHLQELCPNSLSWHDTALSRPGRPILSVVRTL